MNLLAAALARRSGATALRLADETTTEVEVNLAGMADVQPLTLGVRPQHRTLSNDGPEARVSLVEQLGNETILHCSSQAMPSLVVALPGQSEVEEGETVRLALPADRLHVFDREDRALGPAVTPAPQHIAAS